MAVSRLLLLGARAGRAGSVPPTFFTGTYVGDGAATKAIVGVGFQPKYMEIWHDPDVAGADLPASKADVDGLFTMFHRSGDGSAYKIDMIISLDADGFTVGDGTGYANVLNVLGRIYVYTCWGVGGTTQIATGTYIGDGAASKAIIGVGFQPKYLIIYRSDELFNNTPGWKTDQDGLNAFLFGTAGTTNYYAADMIISLDADGFTVGDGTGLFNAFNTNLRGFVYIAFR